MLASRSIQNVIKKYMLISWKIFTVVLKYRKTYCSSYMKKVECNSSIGRERRDFKFNLSNLGLNPVHSKLYSKEILQCLGFMHYSRMQQFFHSFPWIGPLNEIKVCCCPMTSFVCGVHNPSLCGPGSHKRSSDE